MNTIPESQTCTRCGDIKPTTDFYVDRKSKTGRSLHCKQCTKQRTNAYYWANKDAVLASSKAQRKTYRQENKDVLREKLKEWRKANPAKVKAQKYRRRTPHELKGSFTDEQWLALCEKYGNKCLKCNRKAELTVDHIVPLPLGGTNDISNIQPLCRRCNASKWTKTIDYRY